jgi:hypothetical protein
MKREGAGRSRTELGTMAHGGVHASLLHALSSLWDSPLLGRALDYTAYKNWLAMAHGGAGMRWGSWLAIQRAKVDNSGPV